MKLDQVKFAAAILPDLITMGRELYHMFDGDPVPAKRLIKRAHSYKADMLADRAELDAARSAFHAEQAAAKPKDGA